MTLSLTKLSIGITPGSVRVFSRAAVNNVWASDERHSNHDKTVLTSPRLKIRESGLFFLCGRCTNFICRLQIHY